ncbi:MAG: DUF4981 domain-containing protein, partial [Oscillospiraceae bacterium]|nr:DUF4981 domain-containing protein [Oscillospiraceae bacterium]
DVISRMYPMADVMEKLGKREPITISIYDNIANALAADSKPINKEHYCRPVLLCEYAHAMENSLGNFQEYMDDFEKYDNMHGGFIWDFVDQAIRKETENGTEWLYGTDFEKYEPGRYTHLPNTTAMTGSNTYFCANGIIAADRKPHPSYYEVKKVYSEIKVKEKDIAKGEFVLYNKHLFTDLSDFEFKWSLQADGSEIQSGILELNCLPQGETEFTVPYDIASLPSAECVLIISYLNKSEHPWCEKGYEQSFDQFVIKPRTEEAVTAPRGNLQYVKDNGGVFIRGENFTLKIKDGKIVSYTVVGKEILRAPATPNYFRAVTDNDLSNTNFVPPLIPFHPYFNWQKATNSAFGKVTDVAKNSDGQIEINISWSIKLFENTTTKLVVNSDGSFTLTHTGTPKKINLLRFGTMFGILREYNNVKWYGRGPQETYCDRKTGGKITVHEMSVADLEHHYMRPQENGNRTDIRFVEFKNANGKGLRIECTDTPICFSAHHYTQDELQLAKHIHEVPDRDATFISIDLDQLGVGGDMPGDAKVREPYIMHPNKEYTYTFKVIPIV